MTQFIEKYLVLFNMITLLLAACAACLSIFILHYRAPTTAFMSEQGVVPALLTPMANAGEHYLDVRDARPVAQNDSHYNELNSSDAENADISDYCYGKETGSSGDSSGQLDELLRALNDDYAVEQTGEQSQRGRSVICGDLFNYWDAHSACINNEDFARLIEMLLPDPSDQFRLLKSIHAADGWAASDLILRLLNDAGVQPNEHQFYQSLMAHAQEEADPGKTLTRLSHWPLPSDGFIENLRKEYDALSETLENHPQGEVRAYAISTQFWLSIQNKAYDTAFVEIARHIHDPSDSVRQAIYDNVAAVLTDNELVIPEESILLLSTILEQ